MYPAYQEIARLQKNTQAARSVKYALKAEMDHKWMYADARETALEGRRHRRPAGERLPHLRPHRDRRRAGQVPGVRRGEGVLQDVLSPSTSRPTRTGGDGRAAHARRPPLASLRERTPACLGEHRNVSATSLASSTEPSGVRTPSSATTSQREAPHGIGADSFSPASLLAAAIAVIALLVPGGLRRAARAAPPAATRRRARPVATTTPVQGNAVAISGNFTFTPAT